MYRHLVRYNQPASQQKD